jgi:hypothetical protein
MKNVHGFLAFRECSERTSNLVAFLIKEMACQETAVAKALVFEFNSSISFFFAAKMMDHPLRTYKCMTEKNIT